jgi:hypothetical protein
MEGLDALIGKAGDPVPVVDPADMKAMREFEQGLKKRHPDEPFGVGMGLLQQVCSPGADVRAVSYRLNLLAMLEMMLEATYPGGHVSDHALNIAAEMELTWMPVGVPQKSMGFNVEAFLGQVWGTTRWGAPREDHA